LSVNELKFIHQKSAKGKPVAFLLAHVVLLCLKEKHKKEKHKKRDTGLPILVVTAAQDELMPPAAQEAGDEAAPWYQNLILSLSLLLVDKTSKSVIKNQQKKEGKWMVTSFAHGEMAAVALGHTRRGSKAAPKEDCGLVPRGRDAFPPRGHEQLANLALFPKLPVLQVVLALLVLLAAASATAATCRRRVRPLLLAAPSTAAAVTVGFPSLGDERVHHRHVRAAGNGGETQATSKAKWATNQEQPRATHLIRGASTQMRFFS